MADTKCSRASQDKRYRKTSMTLFCSSRSARKLRLIDEATVSETRKPPYSVVKTGKEEA
ncbi:hypothetical protein YC2023_079346 [Brassica napus]